MAETVRPVKSDRDAMHKVMLNTRECANSQLFSYVAASDKMHVVSDDVPKCQRCVRAYRDVKSVALCGPNVYACVRACGSFIVSLCFFYRPQFSLLFLFTLISGCGHCVVRCWSRGVCCGACAQRTGREVRRARQTAPHSFRPRPPPPPQHATANHHRTAPGRLLLPLLPHPPHPTSSTRIASNRCAAGARWPFPCRFCYYVFCFFHFCLFVSRHSPHTQTPTHATGCESCFSHVCCPYCLNHIYPLMSADVCARVFVFFPTFRATQLCVCSVCKKILHTHPQVAHNRVSPVRVVLARSSLSSGVAVVAHPDPANAACVLAASGPGSRDRHSALPPPSQTCAI